MKFSTALFTAASLYFANAAPANAAPSDTAPTSWDNKFTYTFTLEAPNTEVDGKSIQPWHEGAGINYAIIVNGTQGTAFEYDASTHVLSQQVQTQNEGIQLYPFSVQDHHILFSVIGSNPVEIVDNYLSFNGSASSFAACKNTGDTYGYSKTYYELLNYDGEYIPETCIPVLVKAY